MKSQQQPKKTKQEWHDFFYEAGFKEGKAKTLQEVYEKAYKLDWSEDAFVIWLEAELKKVKEKT